MPLTELMLRSWVQDSISWTIGFIIPAFAMGVAVLCFVAGSRRYKHVAPTESPMARVVKVVVAALRNRQARGACPPPGPAPRCGARGASLAARPSHLCPQGA